MELMVRFSNVGITACMDWKMEMVLPVPISLSQTMKGCVGKQRRKVSMDHMIEYR